MTTTARARTRHEQTRVEYRDRTNPASGWQPGTIVFQGERLTVVDLDDGTTRHVYDPEHELRHGRHQHVIDTDEQGNSQVGTLAICPTCAGHGTLFVPDAEQPRITEQPPSVQALTIDDYRLLEIIELNRERGGVYLVGHNSEPWITVYACTERGSWYTVDKARFNIASMGALEAAGMITVTSARTDDDYDALPGLLFKAMHSDGEGRTESDWQGLGVHRPEPTSDPYGRPTREAMAEVLAAALDWLYKTEQPTGAGVTQHGIGSGDLPTIPNRRLGLLPAGTRGGPIICVKTATPVKVSTHAVRNPLAPGELDEWAEVIRDLGYDVAETWHTEPGSISLAQAPHPSLTAAFQLYLQGCPNPGAEHETGSRLCRCTWWREPTRLLVPPTWPKPTPAP